MKIRIFQIKSSANQEVPMKALPGHYMGKKLPEPSDGKKKFVTFSVGRASFLEIRQKVRQSFRSKVIWPWVIESLHTQEKNSR